MRWVFYTSGTTADPKGAQHTDLTVLASALAMSECLDVVPEDVSGLVFPFTHIGGIGWLMAALISGCRVVITEGFDATRHAGAAREERRDSRGVGHAVSHGLPRRSARGTRRPGCSRTCAPFPEGERRSRHSSTTT